MCAESRHLLVAALAAAILLPACTTVNRSFTRVVPPSAPSRTDAVRSVELRLDEGLKMQLRATDAAASAEPGLAPPLGIQLGFEAKLIGYSFDAGQVVLRDRQGAEWRPSGVSLGRQRFGECTPARGVDTDPGYVLLSRGTCLLVRFDRAVSVGDPVELVIAGAALGTRRLEPVTVRLVRVESRWREATPGLVEALTAPIKIMLLPFAILGGG